MSWAANGRPDLATRTEGDNDAAFQGNECITPQACENSTKSAVLDEPKVASSPETASDCVEQVERNRSEVNTDLEVAQVCAKGLTGVHGNALPTRVLE
jgi:hypothetical protein